MTSGDVLLFHFRSGKDTQQLAERYRMDEWLVSRLIWTSRCREKGLPAEYSKRGVIRTIPSEMQGVA